MAQPAEPAEPAQTNEALCPFYGSAHGCPYKEKCELSHADPNSIELCPAFQTQEGCPNPDACYYRHSLLPSPSDLDLLKKYKIAGSVYYSRIINGPAVHRCAIVINRVLWYGLHLIIEDERCQQIHHEKYASVYYYADAVLVAELLGSVLLTSECPGKYLSYIRALIDGDTEPGKVSKAKSQTAPLVHYRDILGSIGGAIDEIPRPVNPHLEANLSRKPWVDFKTTKLPRECVLHPDIYLRPGDLVRVWRPKKLVFHCGIYLGDERIVHISNGVKGDEGMSWSMSLFQSGSAPSKQKYYDYAQHVKTQKKELEALEVPEVAHETKDAVEDADYDKMDDVYGDDMDLVDTDDENGNENQENGNENAPDVIDEVRDEAEEKRGDLLDLFPNVDEPRQDYSDDPIAAEHARRARECGWAEFMRGSRSKDLELGYFVCPWRRARDIVYTAKFLTEIHYMKGAYSVYRNNCEHFALYCCCGLRYSPQASRIETVIDVAGKIGSFAGSILSKVSKVASFRRSPKSKSSGKESEAEAETENYRTHPVIQQLAPLDDGGDDELESMLRDDGDEKKEPKRRSPLTSPLTLAKRKWQSKKEKDCKPSKPCKDDCPVRHGLSVQQCPEGRAFVCDVCEKRILDGEQMHGCRRCNYDVCVACFEGEDVNVEAEESEVPAVHVGAMVDEYENDEHDMLAESIILDANESNLRDLSRSILVTPGGLSQSEVAVASQKWKV